MTDKAVSASLDLLLVSMPFYPGMSACYQIEYLRALMRPKYTVEACHLHYNFARDMFDTGCSALYDIVTSERYVGDYLVMARMYPENSSTILNRLLQEHQSIDAVLNKETLMAFYSCINAIKANLLDKIEETGPKVIGLSATHYQLIPSLMAANWIKEIFPKTTVILGGYLSSYETCKDLLLQHSAIDAIVFGQGESCLTELVDIVVSGRNLDRKVYMGKSVKTLGVLPDFTDFLESGPIESSYKKYLSLSFELSRGCYWDKCDFCNFNSVYGRFRPFKVDQVLESIEFYERRYGIDRYIILDTSMPPKVAKKMGIRQRALKRSIFCEVMIDFTQTSLANIRKFGVDKVQVGIESFSNKHLKDMHKNASVFDNFRFLRDCIREEIQPIYGLLVGRPTDMPDFYWEQVEIIQQIKHLPPPKYISTCDVRPGSPLYSELSKNAAKVSFDCSIFDEIMPPKQHNCEMRPSNIYIPALDNFDTKEAIDALEKSVNEWQKEWKKENSHNKNSVLENKNIEYETSFMKIADQKISVDKFIKETSSKLSIVKASIDKGDLFFQDNSLLNIRP